MMKALTIEKTISTPYVKFEPVTGLLIISGESFPENAAKFYTPVLDWIRQYIGESGTSQEKKMIFEIIYFNSSTSKVFMTIFDILERAVDAGQKITVDWRCDSQNETTIECGEEFKEDLELLRFNIIIETGQSQAK